MLLKIIIIKVVTYGMKLLNTYTRERGSYKLSSKLDTFVAVLGGWIARALRSD